MKSQRRLFGQQIHAILATQPAAVCGGEAEFQIDPVAVIVVDKAAAVACGREIVRMDVLVVVQIDRPFQGTPIDCAVLGVAGVAAKIHPIPHRIEAAVARRVDDRRGRALSHPDFDALTAAGVQVRNGQYGPVYPRLCINVLRVMIARAFPVAKVPTQGEPIAVWVVGIAAHKLYFQRWRAAGHLGLGHSHR